MPAEDNTLRMKAYKNKGRDLDVSMISVCVYSRMWDSHQFLRIVHLYIDSDLMRKRRLPEVTV